MEKNTGLSIDSLKIPPETPLWTLMRYADVLSENIGASIYILERNEKYWGISIS